MREIQMFLVLAEELHFGRAADRLHLTTSSVSQTIRRLERRVGGPLFQRSSRHVELTPLGERFLADLEPAYQAIQTALRTAQESAWQASRPSRLRVAVTPTVSSELLSELTGAFERERPDVRLIQYTMPFALYFDWFSEPGPPANVDVLICWVPSVSLEILRPSRMKAGPVITTSPRALLMAEDHPLAGRVSVDAEELACHDLSFPAGPSRLADAWCPRFTPAGRPIRRTEIAGFPEELAQHLAKGLLHITALKAAPQITQPGLVTVPLTGLPPFLLISTWPLSGDSSLVRAFAESAALQSSGGV